MIGGVISERERLKIDGDEYCTPAEYIDAVKLVFGGEIDLDPASSEFGQSIVQARQYCTKERSGLDIGWHGNIWLNRPYSRQLTNIFVDKFVHEWALKNIDSAIMVVNNATDTNWFQLLCQMASARCFHRGRIRFVHPDERVSGKNGNLQGQVFLYFGSNELRFHDVFRKYGVIL